MTENAKAARRIYEREWRAKNPEKIRARNERYWLRKALAMSTVLTSEEVNTDAKKNCKS